MKILQVINSLNTGGAEKLLLESLPLYKAQDISVELLLLNDQGSHFFKKIQNHKYLKVHILSSYSIYNPINIFKIIPFLKNYDLVHVNLFPSIYWVAIAKLISRNKVKLILTEHATSNRRFRSRYFRPIDKIIYSNYDKIVTISEDVDKVIKNYTGLPVKNFQLISNGVNISSIVNSKPSQDPEILDFLGDKSKSIIQVSRFQDPKDQPTLIKAIALLPNNIKLLLVGDGELKKECEILAEQLQLSNRVKFLGVRMDVPELLKLTDIVVLSTKFEGLSLSSIEGLASGKPFIGSDVPGLTEVVENAGLLFPQGNEKALASRIEQLLNDRQFYNKVTEACVKKSDLYDIHNMISEYSNLYRSLL
jgi:glycosyltransferase involved in cell wall biosynthesis